MEPSSLAVEPFCLASYPSAFHSVMFNPVEPRLIATANSKEGVGLWDIRKPRRLDLFIFFSSSINVFISCHFNVVVPCGEINLNFTIMMSY